MKVSVAMLVLLAACAVTLAVEQAKVTAEKTTALNPVTDAKNQGAVQEQNRDKRHLLGLGALGLGAAALGAGLIGAKAGLVGGALAGGIAGSLVGRGGYGRSYGYDYPVHYTEYNSYNSYPAYGGCTYCDTYRPYPYYASGYDYGYYKK